MKWNPAGIGGAHERPPNLDYANDVEGEEEQPSSFDAVDSDPIATLRSLIRAVG